ncbi:S8 family peptidase [Saccharothrix violaceirubra]|uniref:Subtilisin family serine protease n=1 Tax=Saccharothrix violaceirubra TaxID=413306 RepID=A0A7W7WX83_9PSEU|nr:S8 family peptidase [Saccharothrix violaceirubra]MBB4967174.1 subtilisin family serine protease [Saccharothrix violaceirubra]
MRTLLSGFVGAALVLCAVATPANAEGVVRYADSPDAVPGSYLVKIADGHTVATAGPALALPTFGGYAVRLTPREARRLAADPAVAYVEQDRVVRVGTPVAAGTPWGLDRTDQRALPLDGEYRHVTTGKGVTAYVLDTGIRASHEQFAGRVAPGRDLVEDDDVPQDENGHGTHIAGLVAGRTYGAADGARIAAVRVLDANGTAPYSRVIAGVDWIARNAARPAVANISLGGGPSAALDDAVRGLIASGVTVSVTAGGSGGGVTDTSPARVAEALTSGASTRTDTRAPFSNHGPGVDLYAPGVGITSAWHTSDTATNTVSGTSFATGLVTGVAARHLQAHPRATPAQVHQALVADATPLSSGPLLYRAPTA